MEHLETTLKIIRRLLRRQVFNAMRHQGETRRMAQLDDFCLGYIFGFVCGTFENFGITQYHEKIQVLSRAYHDLFGPQGRDLLASALQSQHQSEFSKGGNCGWEEMKRHLHRREPATGLARYLTEGRGSPALVNRPPDIRQPRYASAV